MSRRIVQAALLGAALACVASPAMAMPQAIGAFVAFLVPSLAGATVLGVAVTTVIGYGILIGGSILVSNLLKPRPRDPNRGADAQAVINQSVGPRVRVYGRAKVGGTRAFFDSKGGWLYQIVMLASHEIDAIEEFWIGDKLAVVQSNGRVSSAPFGYTIDGQPRSHAWLFPFLGTADQTAASTLESAFPGVWTSAHRLRGIAYVVGRFLPPGGDDGPSRFGSIWPQSYNTPIRCVVRGARVYDPRDPSQDPDEDWTNPLTWEWSDNPALCILDYLRHPDGMSKPSSRIDLASFSAFASLCDENVPLAAGGTEKRYRLGGSLILTEDPVDVLTRMLATCDGEFYQTGEGKIAIRGGKWDAPTVTIEDHEILAIGEISEGNDAFAAFNELKIIYTSPEHDYQPQETEPWRDTAAQATHGAIVEDFPLDMVPSPSQGRRLAKIYMHKQNPELRGSIITKLSGLNALGERTLTCVIPELSVNSSFQLSGFSLRPDLTGCEIGISSLTAAAYAWNPATEEGQNPPPPQDTAPDLELPVPQNLVLSIQPREITGGTATDVVVVDVDPPARDDLGLEAQLRQGSGAWLDMTVEAAVPFEAFGTSSVVAGATYHVRARFIVTGGVGAWSAEAAITAPE